MTTVILMLIFMTAGVDEIRSGGGSDLQKLTATFILAVDAYGLACMDLLARQ